MFTPHKLIGVVSVSLTLNWRLNKEVTPHLLDDALLVPEEVTLFNHPDSSTALNITGGKFTARVGSKAMTRPKLIFRS